MDIEKGVGFPIYATDQFSGMFAKLKGEVTGVQDQFTKLNAALAATGLAAVFAAAKKAAEESEAATRRLEAVMRATGNASGFTAAQIGVMADNLARVTQFDDEAFRTATATILRFGDVSGKTLERTLKLSADYAAFMGTDLPSAAEAIGKAIAAPTQGMDRLQRSMGYFTEAQKEAVKAMDETGDRLGAQNALLEIAEKRIGGTAEVMNQGLTKATGDLKKAIGELLEVAGKKGEDSFTVQALGMMSSQLRGLKAIIEDGDWFAKLSGLYMHGGVLGIVRGLGAADVISGNKPMPSGDPAADAAIQAKAAAAAELAALKEFDKASEKWLKEVEDKRKKAENEWLRYQEQTRKLDDAGWVAHIDAMLKADEERLLAEAKINEAFYNGQDKMREDDLKRELAAIDEEIEAREEAMRREGLSTKSWLQTQQDYWKPFLSGIDDAFQNTWDAFVTKGANAGRMLRESLKRTFFDWLYQQFAKPFVLNIVASVGNSMGISGLGSAATAAAGGGNALGGLGSLFSSFSGPEQLSGPVSGIASFLGEAGSMLSTAMPYVAAAIAIYSLFSKSGGGPKEGGSYFGQFTSLGDYLGQGRVPGTDNGRFFTPSGQDSAVAGIGSGAAAQYYASARALGLNTGAFSFGLGFDTDPRGTAPNRVSSGLLDASGRVIYGARDVDIGRDSSAITPALQLEASRMVIAAIKSSELPSYLKKVFDGLTVESATQQQIDDALSAATALKSIFDVVSRNPMEDIATSIAQSQNEYTTALEANSAAMREAMSAFDGTAASTQKLSSATTTYYNAQMQLMLAITQVSQQIDAMFGSTFQNIKLAGLDNQGKYDFYQADTEAARAMLATATDPTQIQQLASRINSNINSAFSLLSPADQKALSAQFISQGQSAQKEIDDRLAKIQKEAADATKQTLDEIKNLLGMNAEDFKQAGADIKAGGAAILEAAGLPPSTPATSVRRSAVVNGGTSR